MKEGMTLRLEAVKGVDSLSLCLTSWPNMETACPCHCRTACCGGSTGKNHPYCWYQHEKSHGGLRLCLPQRVKYGLNPFFLYLIQLAHSFMLYQFFWQYKEG